MAEFVGKCNERVRNEGRKTLSYADCGLFASPSMFFLVVAIDNKACSLRRFFVDVAQRSSSPTTTSLSSWAM